MDINLCFESNRGKIKVSKDSVFRLLSIEGIGASDNKLFVTPVTNSDGSQVDNQTINPRDITIEAEYTGDNKGEVRRKLASFFNLHNDAWLTIAIDDTSRKIHYKVENINIPLININEPLKFLVSLYCPDPYLQDLNETKEEIAIWQPVFSFPLEIDDAGIEMGRRKPSLIARIENEGDTNAGLRIVFKAGATVENPSLFNVDTREYFKVEKTLEAGEQVIVTTGFQNKRVQLIQGGVTSVLHEWDYNSTFLQLNRGMNLFRYDADAGLDNLSVDIYYTQKYVGV